MWTNGRWALNIIDFSTREGTCVLFDSQPLLRNEIKELPLYLKYVAEYIYEIEGLTFQLDSQIDKGEVWHRTPSHTYHDT